MAEQWWSWALTIVGATCFILAGGLGSRKIWWAWYIGLAGQILWLAYSLGDLETRSGFLFGVVLYTAVYVRNAVRWTRERFPKRPTRAWAETWGRFDAAAAAAREREIRRLAEMMSTWADRRATGALAPLREGQCSFSWDSFTHGPVRCEKDVHYTGRHQAFDPQVYVEIGCEVGTRDGSWER